MTRVLLFIGFFAAAAASAPVDLWFEKANTFYEQSAFDSASVYYEKIVASGVNSPDLYYNLGNACYRQTKLGLAVLYYEKAQRLAPNDPDIQNNLRFANLNIVDRTVMPEHGFLEAMLLRLHTLQPLNTQLYMLLCCLMVLALLIAAGLFVPRNVRLWFMYLGSLILAATLLLGVSAGIKIYQDENISYAVVLAPSVDAKNQPGGAKVLFTAHEGTKFKIRKQIDDWSLVSLPNGVSGWVENTSLGTL